MQVAEQARGEVSCSVCGKPGESCTNTCLCPNLSVNDDYLAARTRAAHSPRTNEEFVGTISSHSHGPADFH